MQADTLQFLRYSAPAALATEPRAGMKPTYAFFPTSQIIEALEEDGWTVADARQSGTSARYPTSLNHGKHELILADRKYTGGAGALSVFAEVPRIILSNSHDGNARYTMRAGLLKTACFNGLYVPDGLIQSVGIRHSRRTIEEVVATAQSFRANADLIATHVATLKGVELSPAEDVEFTRQAINLRHPEDHSAVVEISDLLKPQRAEDTGRSLWTVFNRVQEYLLRGGYPVYHRRPHTWAQCKAGKLRAIDKSTDINLKLWELAEQFSLN